MKKNIVFWPGVVSESPLLNEKHGGFDYLEYSKLTWQHFCKKYGHVFIEYNKTAIPDTLNHRVNWQRWFELFDYVESLNIEYDKILMIDGSTMVHWNCPDFLSDAPNDKLIGFRSLENLRWVNESIQGYKKLFNEHELDIKNYINVGFQIFGKWYKPFLKELHDFYLDNYEKICILQKNISRGTDQPIMNYFIDIKKIPTAFDSLPNSYFLMHMNRFNWFHHNWQLNEDMTPYFIKYAYVWVFSGFDRTQRQTLMSQTWEFIKENYNYE
jgi:hypothetical protein